MFSNDIRLQRLLLIGVCLYWGKNACFKRTLIPNCVETETLQSPQGALQVQSGCRGAPAKNFQTRNIPFMHSDLIVHTRAFQGRWGGESGPENMNTFHKHMWSFWYHTVARQSQIVQTYCTVRKSASIYGWQSVCVVKLLAQDNATSQDLNIWISIYTWNARISGLESTERTKY